MGNKAGFGIGGFVLLSVVMFIIPIPSVLLDVLLAVNLSLAMIVLFNAMFSKEALDMSSSYSRYHCILHPCFGTVYSNQPGF